MSDETKFQALETYAALRSDEADGDGEELRLASDRRVVGSFAD